MESKRKYYIAYIVIMAVVLVAIVILVVPKDSNINNNVTIEAGEKIPAAGAFLIDSTQDVEFVTDISLINVNVPGVYDVKISSGNKKYDVKLKVEDTLAPVANIIDLDLYESRTIKPEEFVNDIKDVTDVSVKYKTGPDFVKIGKQKVIILLEDTSGNKSEYQANLRISKVKEIVEVDISEVELGAAIFLKDLKDLDESVIVGNVPPDSLGVFPISIKIGDTVYDSSVHIIDRIPPKGKAVDKEFWTVDKISPLDFVTEVEDATDVTAEFVEEPDLTHLGEQIVKIMLIDRGGNTTPIEAMLTLKADIEPPTIYGVVDQTAIVNTPISFKRGVYVIDNRDTDLSVTVDYSGVNIKQVGTYPLVYSATDASGNTSKREAKLSLIEKPDDLIDRAVVEELANSILANIITDNMTLEEKALAIYKYINKNVYYLGGRHSDDIITEAYYALMKDPGDCYTYFAASDLMLNLVGIPNIRVERLKYEGESNHYWHMINCGEGWYHFDPSIHSPAFFSFMLTDAEAEAYSREKGANTYYYRHDKEKYPATPDQ